MLCEKNREKLTMSDKIDRIVTNRFLAIPIFAVVMYLVYFVSVTTVGTWATDWANDGVFGEGWSLFGLQIPGIPGVVSDLLTSIGCTDWLQGLIVDGIIGGVGAVLGFVPQMLVLFIFLAFLEACGYMARIAFIMDRIFRRFGLSGKSFIPMLIGTGCRVPGVMASRTIENDRDRKMTIMTTTFIPCGAKLPIIALIAGALFGGASWVAPSAYFVGIAAIICSGIILKRRRCLWAIRHRSLWSFLHITCRLSEMYCAACGSADGPSLKGGYNHSVIDHLYLVYIEFWICGWKIRNGRRFK